MQQFKDKVAIVTGGASGIGAATVAQLRAAGARVAVIDRRTDDADADLVISCNVLEPGHVRAAIEDAAQQLGGLDAAVNAAGVSPMPTAFTDVTPEDWAQVIGINLTGVFICMQYEIQEMLAREGGSIVNVSSGAGLVGYPGLPAYVASKHGVLGLTKTAALEYARQGIRVNAVCPGLVRTPMLAGSLSMEEIDKMGRRSPMGRVAEADEIASVIVHLLSDDAAYVTGTASVVDGGALAT
jgi:NAD(P)-dependent dehydrogenase (short-subunit alcohol dehydrogenase family)